jgi:hypothetical protein
MTPGRGDARKQGGGPRSRASEPAARTGKPAKRSTSGRPPERAGKPAARTGKPASPSGKPAARTGKPATRKGSDGQGRRAAPGKRSQAGRAAKAGGPPARGGKPGGDGRRVRKDAPVRGLRQSGALWRRPDADPVAPTEAPAPRERPAKQGQEGDGRRAPLRVVRGGKARPAARPPGKGAARRNGAVRRSTARRARGPSAAEVRDEIVRQGGARGTRFYERFARAADAYAADRERDAIRILRPLRDALPNAAGVRELLGLTLYAAGRYGPAAEELEEYVARTGAVDRHPVLMDCYRSDRNWARVDALWDELCATSASPDVMTEGRIVVAGSLADRGRLRAATALLRRRATQMPKRVEDHHLRLWYALADLEERGGNLPRARELFTRIRQRDPGFADVAERVAALA